MENGTYFLANKFTLFKTICIWGLSKTEVAVFNSLKLIVFLIDLWFESLLFPAVLLDIAVGRNLYEIKLR